MHAAQRPACMADEEEEAGDEVERASTEVEPPTASFQAMALASAKKREAVAKAEDVSMARRICQEQVGSASMTAGPPGYAAQPLARSGSTNAGLRHAPSFDLDARASTSVSGGGDVAGWKTGVGHAVALSAHAMAVSTSTVTREMHKVSLSARSVPMKKRPQALVRRGIKRL